MKIENNGFKNILGDKFGLLTAIEKVTRLIIKTGKYRTYWKCNCECGGFKTVWSHSLIAGITKSCGCLEIKNRMRFTTHNKTQSSEYSIWRGIIGRCCNEKHPSFKNYGGRGITICNEWKESFENFYRDMGDRPINTTLDRKNNNLGYYKENCRWVDWKIQHRNKRTNHLVTYKNETKTLQEWSEIYKINKSVFCGRLKLGWDIEKALTTPVYKK